MSSPKNNWDPMHLWARYAPGASRTVPSGWPRWPGVLRIVCFLLLGLISCAAAQDPKQETESAGQMMVTGKVLGADGKPVAGCQMGLLTRHYRRSEKPEGTWPFSKQGGLSKGNQVAATGLTGAEGRFRLSWRG